jgi:hypothetical protein
MRLVHCARLLVAGAACALLVAGAAPASTAPSHERIEWLWDNAAPPRSAQEVAVLVAHVHLTGDEVRERRRQDTPHLDPATRITPVVHVEVSTVRAPVIGAPAHDAIVAAVLRASRWSTSGWVQLDMEARPSHRSAYLALVHDIRAQLPPDTKLSVTALAWWCRSHAWLDDIAADEVVPMVFRMGRDTQRLRELWLREPRQLHPRCRGGAIGTATIEPLPDDVTARYAKEYVFDPRGWRTEVGKRGRE